MVRLLGEAGNVVEVPVVVQDLRAAGAGGRRDDEGRPVLGLLGQRFLNFGGLYQTKTRTTKAEAA